MTDTTTPEQPATPTNPEQVNPVTSFDATARPATTPTDSPEQVLLTRIRTSLAAWPDTHTLAVEFEGETGSLVFGLDNGSVIVLTVDLV